MECSEVCVHVNFVCVCVCVCASWLFVWFFPEYFSHWVFSSGFFLGVSGPVTPK